MIRTLLTTTALTALLVTGAMAQDAAAPATNDATTIEPFDLSTGYQAVDTDDLATRIIGAPVYTSAANDAENIGEINDLVLDQGGDIRAVIIGVGGFLGMGEKNVAVDFSQLKMVVAEDNTERWVLETTKEALNAAPAFEFIEDSPDSDTAATNPDNTMAPATDAATTPATDTAAATPSTDAADTNAANEQQDVAEAQPDAATPAPAPLDRTTMTNLDAATLTAEELIGTRVVGPDDDQIAEVGDLVLTEDGQVDAVLVDFGGFLGIGEKRVAVAMDNLQFLSDENGNRYVFLESITKEQLDAAPAYDEVTYAQDRDNQRLTLGAM
jgi:sporulation protein YlmC with PRC-barrel domain